MQNKAKLVRRYFEIFLSLLTVAVGILFIVQACGIFADAGYVQGGYTRETVGTRFLYVCAPFFIWIAAIIAAIHTKNGTQTYKKRVPIALRVYPPCT